MLSDGDALILLHAMVVDGQSYKTASEKLEDPIFDPATQYAFDFVCRNFMEMCQEAGEKISKGMLRARIKDAIGSMSTTDREWEDDVSDLLDGLDTLGSEVSRTYVDDLLLRVANEQLHAASEKVLSSILEREEPSNVQAKLGEEMDRLIRSKTFDSGVDDAYINPLLQLPEMMLVSKPWPFGVDFFDEMTAGGARANMLWGFLAPPSGGKTTMAVQLSVNWVKQSPEHHAVLFSYEQPIQGDITSRVLCQATGEAVRLFRDKQYDSLDEGLKTRISERARVIGNRLHMFDFSKPKKGLLGMTDIVRGLEALHILRRTSDIDPDKTPPVVVFIDWLIPLIQRRMTADDAGMLAIGSDLRGYGTKFMDELKAFKNKYHVLIMINHQLNTAAGSGSACRMPSWSDAAEWKGFAWMLDNCFGVGNRTEHDICIMACTKIRAAARSYTTVKLDGEFCRFVDASSEYMVNNGKMVQKSLVAEREANQGTMASRLAAKLPTSIEKVRDNFLRT